MQCCTNAAGYVQSLTTGLIRPSPAFSQTIIYLIAFILFPRAKCVRTQCDYFAANNSGITPNTFDIHKPASGRLQQMSRSWCEMLLTVAAHVCVRLLGQHFILVLCIWENNKNKKHKANQQLKTLISVCISYVNAPS